MKTWLTITWLALIFSAIAGLFWQNEWKYSLPTPVPAAHQKVETGTYLNTSTWLKYEKQKPLFLHFFNPDCPCSRFNMTHFKSLVKEYGDRVNFCLVLVSAKEYSAQNIQHKYDLSIPVLTDSLISNVCGVYSTPQAVLIDKDQKLIYRGNYNKSRYCTNKNTNYAQRAIDSLLFNPMNAIFETAATTSYGCSLPGCSK